MVRCLESEEMPRNPHYRGIQDENEKNNQGAAERKKGVRKQQSGDAEEIQRHSPTMDYGGGGEEKPNFRFARKVKGMTERGLCLRQQNADKLIHKPLFLIAVEMRPHSQQILHERHDASGAVKGNLMSIELVDI
jgi:hypothetical protein